eukprot:TRINITY_DN25363_c0_g1_i1.p1 TRINITY_DN25363_c0_g1~~TRINITY_DN25363_c0_g1_i1.p1  ORF type:complete len:213 (+),score=63.36 TRINITY_DN25363_c0_g1_i1:91-729(+)
MVSVLDLKKMGEKFHWVKDIAKSDKSKCKLCKQPIAKGEPRLGYNVVDLDCGGGHWGVNWGYFHPQCAVEAGQKWKVYDKVPPGLVKGGGKSAAKAASKGKSKAAAAAKGASKAVTKAKVKPSPMLKQTAAPRGGSSSALAGKVVVFTGTLSVKRAVAEAAAKSAGAKIGSGVTKNTSIVVCGADAGSKIAKAAALGVTVWDEKQFKKVAKC